MDQSDLWFEWVIWQTGRNRPLSISLTNFAQIDPVITIIGIAGFIWTGFKKDFFPLLWVGPFLIFSYFIGWVQYFHLIVIFPAFCIGSAVLINDIQRFIRKRLILRSGSMLLSQVPFIIVSLFGLVILTILITSNVNSSYYRIYASIASNIPDVSNASGNNSNVTLVGSHWWVWSSYWITQYVLGKHHELVDPHLDPNFKLPLTTKNVIYIDDNKFLESISRKVQSNSLYQIKKLHDESAIRSTFIDNVTSADDGRYPNNIFSIMILNENHPVGQVVIKRNF